MTQSRSRRRTSWNSKSRKPTPDSKVIPPAAAHVFGDNQRAPARGAWRQFVVRRIEWLIGTRLHQLGVIVTVIGICAAIIVYLTPPFVSEPEDIAALTTAIVNVVSGWSTGR